MAFALPELDILVAAILALGFCLLVVAISKAFFGVTGTLLGKLPIVGGWIDSTAHHIEQRIANVFGGYAAQLEGVIGASWHGMARIVDKIGEQLAKHAGLLAALASGLPGFGTLVSLYREIALAKALVSKLAHELVGIGHDVGTRVKVIERGIGNDVLPSIRALDREIDRVVTRDVAGLRARARTLEREYERLFRWIKTHGLTAGTAAFAGAVALALAKLGLSWIRCPTAKSVFNKRGCNLWSDLDKLLGLVAEGLLLTNICAVIPWLESAFSVVAAPLIETLTAVGAGLCSATDGPPEFLPAPGIHIPANPDATLYLPG